MARTSAFILSRKDIAVERRAVSAGAIEKMHFVAAGSNRRRGMMRYDLDMRAASLAGRKSGLAGFRLSGINAHESALQGERLRRAENFQGPALEISSIG
jgi:hypothetical protein